MTTVAYKSLTQAEQIFHDIFWRPVVIAGEYWLETTVPFFALPIIKQVEEGIVNELSEQLFKSLVLFIDINAIKFVNSAHQSAYDSASLKLRIVATEHGLGSEEYRKARDEAKKALSDFSFIASGQ